MQVASIAFDHAIFAERDGMLWAALAENLGANITSYGEELENVDYAKLEPVSSMSRLLSDE